MVKVGTREVLDYTNRELATFKSDGLLERPSPRLAALISLDSAARIEAAANRAGAWTTELR